MRPGLRFAASALVCVVLIVAGGSRAGAAEVGANVHGWFSGANEVWAGKFPVDVSLNYRASAVSQGSAPGFVNPTGVDFDVLDPTGHPSTKLSVTYQYFTQYRPPPIGEFGPLDPFDVDHSHWVQFTAAADAADGTWRVRPHMNAFYWELNGLPLSVGYNVFTINTTEDWYAVNVHGAAVPAATTTRGGTGQSGGGAGPAPAGSSLAPATTAAAGPSAESTTPAAASAASAAAAAAPDVRRPVAGYPWIVYAFVGLVTAALVGSMTFGGLRLRARRAVSSAPIEPDGAATD